MYLDKFQVADFKYDKSFPNFCLNTQIKSILVTNLKLFCFAQNFAIGQV